MRSDVQAEQRLQGFEPLAFTANRAVLIAATSPSQQKGQALGSNRRKRSRRFYISNTRSELRLYPASPDFSGYSLRVARGADVSKIGKCCGGVPVLDD